MDVEISGAVATPASEAVALLERGCRPVRCCHRATPAATISTHAAATTPPTIAPCMTEGEDPDPDVVGELTDAAESAPTIAAITVNPGAYCAAATSTPE